MSAVLQKLSEAVEKANIALSENGYTVTVTNQEVKPKEPIFLRLHYADGKTPNRNVGITHLVHLSGDDWDSMPYERIAKTTDQIAKAIVDRVTLFFAAEKQGLYIDDNGTIFDFKKIRVKRNEDHTFSVNDIEVTFGGKPLLLTLLKSEGIVEFRQLGNGHIELFDAVDQRAKKGIFIDTDGKIYRA
jgi:hypothetical protein